MKQLVRVSLQLLWLGAIALAIPVSLLEDIKDAQLQSPIRTNKVKRAQEVIMFGNQQNRALNNYGSPRTEKRDVSDNSLGEEVATLAKVLPEVEEQGYDTNQLESGSKDYDKPYPYISREPNYSMLLANGPFKQALPNHPVLNFNELPLYNMMDARRKREAQKIFSSAPKASFRPKREYDLSPEELLALMRLLESDRHPNSRLHESRNPWPIYGTNPEDFEAPESSNDENEVDTDSEYNRNGVWVDSPVGPNQRSRDGDFWPRKYKRFMVSKRRIDNDAYSPQLASPYDFPEGVPLQRRFMI